MTQEDYDKILKLKEEYKTYQETEELLRNAIQKTLYKKIDIWGQIEEICDHEFPSEQSAIENRLYNECSICGTIL